MSRPKILFIDIETAPIVGYAWGLWDVNIALNQIKKDWHILSWCAKWQGEGRLHYEDQRGARKLSNDKKIMKKLWKLMDAADIIVGQNSTQFDVKKINARFIINGMNPPSSYRQIDTLKLARKYFGFTSNKLEYLSNHLGIKTKKLTKREFAGFDLWKECLAGNIKAWKEMEKYNKKDVLALEEVYNKLKPWDNGRGGIDFSVYDQEGTLTCACGSQEFAKWGKRYEAKTVYQRLKCKKCGAEHKQKIKTK